MEPAALCFGRFQLDPLRRVLLEQGAPVRLGSRAVDLLIALVQQRTRVVSKAELFDLVWPDLVVEENNLQQHISALRKLLGAQAIATVPGRGYQFILPLDRDVSAAPIEPEFKPQAPRPQHRLPARPPALVGRDDDLAALCARLEEHALVSVVGPGGIGKTRLALAAAHACADRWADGVWVVDLSPLSESAQVAATVAHELDIVLPTQRGALSEPQACRAVAAALRRQALLLVLDNCEHLLDAVAALVQALALRAPQVRVLVTSQEPLRLDDEQVLRLAPLALPPGPVIDPEEACRFAAVQLLVQRAQALDRDFAPSAANVAALVEICQRLDGLPLAIELAAARLPLLGVHGVHQRLDQHLQLLARRDARAPPRQQTLRAALAWSHDLLDGDDQIVFRRLAVFAGGFSIELAQRVLADEGAEPWAVLDRLGTLVDKSLLMSRAGGEPRYRLLESARGFALEQLEQSGELRLMRQRHARAMAEMLQSLNEAVAHEPRFEPLVQRLAPELDNLRTAMHWLLAAGQAHGYDAADARHTAIVMAAHSDFLWGELDSPGERLALCRAARAWLDDSVPLVLASRLRLAYQGVARASLQLPSDWRDDLRQAIAGFRTARDRIGLYRALCELGAAPRGMFDDAEAGALLAEAQALEDPRWSPRLRRRLQVSLEWWHDLGGRLPQSREAGLKNLALARAAGGLGEISALGNLADTEFALGNAPAAIALCREALARAAAMGRPDVARNAYENMVPALLELGDQPAAEAAIRAGRALHVRTLGSAFTMLVPLALLLARRGDVRLALPLIGCAMRAYAEAGQELHPPEQRMRDAVMAAAATTGSAAERVALVQEGEGWTEDEGFARGGLDRVEDLH